MSPHKYRFLFIAAYKLPDGSRFDGPRKFKTPVEKYLNNLSDLEHLLTDVEWETHEGPESNYGDWGVENRYEFASVVPGRLKIVKEACESGKYNGIILLGGGEPGFPETREITRRHGIVATSCGFSQMHVASMLGRKFSVIDFSDAHNAYYRDIVVRNGFADRCASIRNLGYYHGKPDYSGEPSFKEERKKAQRGEHSEGVERAVEHAVDALENDGAEVITMGCSATFWLKPFLEKRLHDLGWEVPVLEGYGCAISLAKMMIDLDVNASGLTYPGDRPKKRPRRLVL